MANSTLLVIINFVYILNVDIMVNGGASKWHFYEDVSFLFSPRSVLSATDQVNAAPGSNFLFEVFLNYVSSAWLLTLLLRRN